MTLLTLPKVLTPGTLENVSDVTSNFTAVSTLVNGGLDGDNLSQTTGEQLAVSSTTAPRRGRTRTSLLDVAGTAYTQVIRAPTVVVAAGGLLFVSLQAPTFTSIPVTISFAVQLNGVTARSRYGGGTALMEVTGLSVPGPGAVLYTDHTTDSGLGSTVSTISAPANDTQPIGAFVPIIVGAGAYVVDFLARIDTGPDLLFSGATLRVRTEGF